MIPRRLKTKLLESVKKFPTLALLGPRQSGKTTLVRAIFPDYGYLSLEDLDVREFAKTDPRGFLKTHAKKPGVILDEVQNVPELLSYIQTHVDESQEKGQFVLTGSQNLLLSEHITQSLAGRVAIHTLLPLSISELSDHMPESLEEMLFNGCYARIYSDSVTAREWYPNYIRTYLERDVRQIKQIGDLSSFQRFLKLCAGRIGQLLNLSSLANDCGISVSTAKSWISVLEMSYIVFRLHPHHKNFSKRLIKMPKLYFYDTGVACSLLSIDSPEHLTTHYLRGGLFESLIISDLIKNQYNVGREPSLYFWRDKLGHEIDCIIEKGENLTPIEVKSGLTINTDYFKELTYWRTLAKVDPSASYVVYGGSENQKRKEANVVSWRSIDSISGT